jgi:two-component system response regulator YesN
MYKIILVDDEDVILDSLEQTFDWGKMGFSVVSTHTDAASALSYLKENEVHIVISDVKMPGMSGVSMAAEIGNLYPDILVVLLSGYKDFDYAVKAIKAGVFSYLLKPLSYGDVEKMCKELNQELAKRKDSGNFNDIISADFQKTVYDCLFNKSGTEKITGLFQSIGIDLNLSPIVMLDVTLDCLDDYLKNSWQYETNRLYSAVNHIAVFSENIVLAPLSYAFDKIKYLAVSKETDIENFVKTITGFKNSLTKNCLDILNLVTIISIGQIFSGIDNYLTGAEYKEHAKTESYMLMKTVEAGKIDAAAYKINEIIASNQENSDYLNMFAYEMYLCLEAAVSYDNMVKYKIYSVKLPLKMSESNIPYEIEKITEASALTRTVKNAAAYFKGDVSGDDTIMNAVRQYIDKNYNEAISLSILADSVYLSEYHFCRWFKKKFNMNFVDYLNKVRIEKAMRLLTETTLKTNEIYSMAGYQSLKYFHKKFKNHTGVTPREYRNKVISEEDL